MLVGRRGESRELGRDILRWSELAVWFAIEEVSHVKVATTSAPLRS